MALFPIPDPPSPEWLTAALRHAGRLPQGAIATVEQRLSDAFNSQTSFLRLTYVEGDDLELPTRLVLKRNGPQAWSIEAGAEEVRFYQTLAALPDHPPLTIPCYGAGYDAASGQSYILLQDLSLSHAPPITRDQQLNLVEGVPPVEYIDAVVETLARLHGYWWDHPLLESGPFITGYWSRNAERFGLYRERRQAAWQSLIAAEATWFPTDLRELYEHLLNRLPDYWTRYLEPRFRTRTQLTLVHGDAYFANFLCPLTPASGPTYLLDWQSPTVDLGSYDLANLIAAFWTPEQRHAQNREENILRSYHAGLQARGVTGYTWADLTIDYRQALIFWVLMPVQDRHGGAPQSYWWPKMQCLVAAYRDWQCADLLG